MAWAALRFSTNRQTIVRGLSRTAVAPWPRPRMGIVMLDFALGGTERIAVRLANKWSELGVELEIFCGVDEGPMRALLNPAVNVVRALEPIARGKGALKRLGAAARTHFAERPVDALYVTGNTHWPIIRPLTTLPAAKRPKIVAQISAALSKPQRGAFRQRCFELRMRQKLRGVDQVVGLCWEAAREAGRMLGRSDVAAIPLPALDDCPLPLVPPPGSERPVILAASRLVPGKGVERLIEAFARLDHPTARLVIAGSGPNEAEVRRLVTSLGIADRVELLGYVPDIRPHLDRANFLAMPSDYEGYPAVIVEALAAGRPVLATDCSPAVRELLGEPEAGLVVPIADVAALSEGLAKMIGRPPVAPEALASRVERFRMGPVARRYLSLVGIAPGNEHQPARRLIAANDRADCLADEAAL